MIIVLKPDATQKEIDHILEKLKEFGLKPHVSRGEERVIIGAIGDERVLQNQPLTVFPGVEVSTSEGHLLAMFIVLDPRHWNRLR